MKVSDNNYRNDRAGWLVECCWISNLLQDKLDCRRCDSQEFKIKLKRITSVTEVRGGNPICLELFQNKYLEAGSTAVLKSKKKFKKNSFSKYYPMKCHEVYNQAAKWSLVWSYSLNADLKSEHLKFKSYFSYFSQYYPSQMSWSLESGSQVVSCLELKKSNDLKSEHSEFREKSFLSTLSPSNVMKSSVRQQSGLLSGAQVRMKTWNLSIRNSEGIPSLKYYPVKCHEVKIKVRQLSGFMSRAEIRMQTWNLRIPNSEEIPSLNIIQWNLTSQESDSKAVSHLELKFEWRLEIWA